jgi:hypothetical protein
MAQITPNQWALNQAKGAEALKKLQEDSAKGTAADVETRRGFQAAPEKSTAYEDFKKSKEAPAT